MIKALVLLLTLISFSSYSQREKWNKQWQFTGPNQEPSNPKFRGDGGIGPIEFVRVYKKKEGFLLAGSLNGGLFFSENGGDLWVNSGSDQWDYSGCAWADFYPDDEETWFACSNFSDNNGKPGLIEKKGGLLRTRNQGRTWFTIGNYKDFGGSKYLTIYGTRFHPGQPKKLFILTSEGLFYTNNCLSDFVKWNRVPNLKGWVYDLDFLGEKMYVSNFFHGKWNVLQFDQNDLSKSTVLKQVFEEDREMRNLTFEPRGNALLIAKDFTKNQDELWELDPTSDEFNLKLKGQRISFGSGHTLAVSPFNENSYYFGYGTRIKKWNNETNKQLTVGINYHVDIEFIAFDPFDSTKVFLATHGGVFLSTDQGLSWKSKSNGLGVAEVTGLAVSKMNTSQIAIGCFHDGSMLYTDYGDGQLLWRTINGGDGLIPLIDPDDETIVYTSNQYTGGGIFVSKDSAKQKKENLHNFNSLKTSGWEMAAALHPEKTNVLFFNFRTNSKENIDICRTRDATKRNSAEIISDFSKSHQLTNYKVYGLFNSKVRPESLYAYVLDYEKGEDGKQIITHRIFWNNNVNQDAEDVINEWRELEHPINTWIADIAPDGYATNRVFVSYTKGKDNPETIFGDKGLIYALKYSRKEPYRLKREIDITRNVPNSIAGRFNVEYVKRDGGGIFIATRTGIYYGNKKVLKGRYKWQKVGYGLPHCKISGLDYNESEKVLTVGYFGRGVWQYYFID